MKPKAALRLQKAERFLGQATALEATISPEGVVHLAYYAMYHAAAAVLLERTGSAPKKHASMVGQFGELARAAGSDAMAQARRFNVAEDWRVTADYDEEPSVTPQDALRVRDDAIAFVVLCRQLLGL